MVFVVSMVLVVPIGCVCDNYGVYGAYGVCDAYSAL